MDKLLEVDWFGLIDPTHSLAEMVVRGTVMYIFLFLALRVFLRRQAGALGLADLLLVVIIADAAQNSFAKEYRSLSEGITLALTIVFWDYILDWLGYRIEWFRRLLHPAPLLLVRDGKMLWRNMRKEAISEEELMSQLRERGIEATAEVRKAYIEGDGRLSVIKKNKKGDNYPPRVSTTRQSHAGDAHPR